MLKSFKYRLYPNKEQELQLQNTFGCSRFVYNTMLDYKINQIKNGNKKVSKIDCNNYSN